MRHMKAKEIFRVKQIFGAGIVEILIWLVPETVPPSEHPYKYRLVYVEHGQRVVGYDNERGKGDHKHIGAIEMPYSFVSPEQLMADLKEHGHE